MTTNFLELATTLKYLGAKWLPETESYFYALNFEHFEHLMINLGSYLYGVHANQAE